LAVEVQLARPNINQSTWRRESSLINPAPKHLVDHANDQQAGQNEQH
jgi:hypothetical protein